MNQGTVATCKRYIYTCSIRIMSETCGGVEADDTVHELRGEDDLIKHRDTAPDQPRVASLGDHGQAPSAAVTHQVSRYFMPEAIWVAMYTSAP